MILDIFLVQLVEVVMQLEEQFDLRIPEDQLDGVTTIGAAAGRSNLTICVSSAGYWDSAAKG